MEDHSTRGHPLPIILVLLVYLVDPTGHPCSHICFFHPFFQISRSSSACDIDLPHAEVGRLTWAPDPGHGFLFLNFSKTVLLRTVLIRLSGLFFNPPTVTVAFTAFLWSWSGLHLHTPLPSLTYVPTLSQSSKWKLLPKCPPGDHMT